MSKMDVGKITGIKRTIDSGGRVVIPKEIREMLNWNTGDDVEVNVTTKGVLISKIETGCANCGTSLNLVEFAGKYFCRTCLKEAAKL